MAPSSLESGPRRSLCPFSSGQPVVAACESALCSWQWSHALQHTASVAPSCTVDHEGLQKSTDNTCRTSSSDSSTSVSYVHQAWQLKRPNLQHDPKLTRRQLRQLGRTWSLSDVAQHKYCDDGWIAVDGKVYDITEHIATHPGWDSGCRVTEVLSIIAHLGCDCSQEFHEIHRSYPVSYKQLAAYFIGDLQP